MAFIFGLAIIFAAFAFVAYPLISPSRKNALIKDEMESELQFKKDSTYSALKELEFDYEIGNLSPEDHRNLEERYKEKAIKILKDMDKLGKKSIDREASDKADIDDIEKEILKARGGEAGDIEEEIMAVRGKKGGGISRPGELPQMACPSCNRKVSGTAKFCSSCGASLSLACPSCGKAVRKGNKFCSECGAKVN